MAGTSHERLSPRRQVVIPCTITDCGDEITGTIENISKSGMAVSLLTAIPPGKQEAVRISLQEPIVVSALPVHAQNSDENFLVGFHIMNVETGAREWTQLNAVPH